jgi:GxxExxY protein
MDENRIGAEIVDGAVKVHRALGPGLLESVYELAFAHELERRGLQVQRQVPIAVRYEDKTFDEGFRADLIVGGKVLVELKAVEAIVPVHKRQVLTYIKLANLRLGYLLNFGAPFMKDGMERIVLGLPESVLGVSASLRED